MVQPPPSPPPQSQCWQVYKARYQQKQSEYQLQYQEFLREKVGGKRKQEMYHAALREHKAKMREYMMKFRLRKKNLLKVSPMFIARS